MRNDDTTDSSHAAPDTRTMGIVHSALRRDLTRARLVLTDHQPLSDERRQALADHLVWMMVFLDRHHTSEDEGLYPMVLRKNPAARDLLQDMDADHQRIHPAMERVAEAAGALHAPSATAPAELLTAIDELESVLYPHLRREEEEAMPLVAATITAADWHTWDEKHNIKGLSFGELATTGLWTLDGQDPVSHALMSQAVPRPVLFVIKRVFGPRYRRKTARLWGGTRAANVRALTKEMVEISE
jgi:hemerythrin-like domain-containing protein